MQGPWDGVLSLWSGAVLRVVVACGCWVKDLSSDDPHVLGEMSSQLIWDVIVCICSVLVSVLNQRKYCIPDSEDRKKRL